MSCFFAKASAFVLLGIVRWLELVAAQLALPFPAMAATPLVDAVACNSATGFFVSAEGDLVSAAHVLGKCAHAIAITAQGVRFGRRIAVAEDHDIALFRFEGGTPASAVFPTEALNMFWSPVTSVGFRACGGPNSLSLNDGHAIAGFRQLPDTVGLMTDAVILGGNSGSPVVDSAGRVVGMLVARSKANARVGYAVSADRLKAFLTDHGVAISEQPEPLSSLFEPAGAGTAAVPFTVGVACIM